MPTHELYEEIVDNSVADKIRSVASVLGSDRKAHVFCQRAVKDLTGSPIEADGRMGQETIDAINFAIRSGLSKQFKIAVAHYAANYVQSHVSPSSYGKYLIKLFS